ncbi:hypothetical protein FACS1894166_12500 [Bacilli bacterium]|nr:hypothetical protein FACS1894166_12500 [Bacilli bacterium]
MAELNHNTSNFKNDLNEQAKLFNKKPEVVENNYYTGIVLNKIIGLTNKITIGGGRILEEVYGIKTNDKSIRIGTLGGMPKGKRVALIVLLEK